MKVDIKKLQQALEALGDARVYYKHSGDKPRIIVFLSKPIIARNYYPDAMVKPDEILAYPDPENNSWLIDI